jgi:hypothetical protein
VGGLKGLALQLMLKDTPTSVPSPWREDDENEEGEEGEVAGDVVKQDLTLCSAARRWALNEGAVPPSRASPWLLLPSHTTLGPQPQTH